MLRLRPSTAVLLVGGLLVLSSPLLAKTASTPGLPAGASSNPGGGTAPAPAPGTATPSGTPPATDPLVTKQARGVNINSASLEDLLRLPGMTTQRAQAVMRNRPYAQVDDLVKKKVLKTSTFDRIKPYIIVNN